MPDSVQPIHNIGAIASLNGTKPTDSSKNQTQVVAVHAPTVTPASDTVRSAKIGANASFNGPRPVAPLKQLSSVTFAPAHDSKPPTSVKQPSTLLHNNNRHGKPTFNKVDINLKKQGVVAITKHVKKPADNVALRLCFIL